MASCKFRNICLLFLTAIFCLQGMAQEKKGFPVIGNITSEAGVAENARATIYQDRKELQVIGIESNGRFNLTFPFNHDYTVVISGDDCFPKKIAISTFVPRRVEEKDPKFPPFVVDQSLFTEVKGINTSFSDNIILQIFYDPGIDNFISEVFYNDSQIKKQIENAIWRSQQVGRTAEELAKLTDEELRLMRQEYQQWIKEAGESYAQGQYQEALMGYKAANRLFPEEQFPIDRIAEINDLLLALQITANLEQIQAQKFQALISEADGKFELNAYAEAKNLYRQALNINANDPHATTRIGEIEQILARQEAEAKYDLTIIDADRLFENGDLQGAKRRFNEALSLKPGEEYPQSRLKDIKDEEDRLEKLALQQQRYEEALAEGDDFRDKQQYLRARETYDFALSFKPGDPVATERIAQVDELMKAEKLDKDYENAISDADRSFKKEEYNEALTFYRQASDLKPEEEYPETQISEINRILENERQLLLAEKERLKAHYKELDSLYNEAITSANILFNDPNFSEAASYYEKALEIKPGMEYPALRLKEIKDTLVILEAQKKEYDKFIAEADRFYSREDFSAARESYQKAKSAKPGETYPDEMAARIDSVEKARAVAEERARAAEEARLRVEQETRDREYNQAIIRADRHYGNKAYNEAIAEYNNALKAKPGVQYPRDKIIEIEGILEKLAEAQEQYEKIIADADKSFNREDYTAARELYNSTKEIKPDENYPGQMIDRIDSIKNAIARAKAAEQEATDRAYNQAITRADKCFILENYEGAVEAYQEASDIKPNEPYPKQRLNEVKEILAELAKTEQDYKNAVEKADKAFERKEYEEAKDGYNLALTFKPEESYPKGQLVRISEILGQLAREEERQMNYLSAIEKADNLFGNEDYFQAITAYRQALLYNPGKKYPEDQIDLANKKIEEINRQAQQQEELNRLYRETIAGADNAFRISDYDEAENGYNKALKIKPGEQYPRDQLTLIVQKREEEVRNRYNSLVSQADALLGREEYREARELYREAFNVLAGDEYARKKIGEIDAIIDALARAEQEHKERNRKYAEEVSLGDEAFHGKLYQEATGHYRNALTVKPDEEYPKRKIQEIDDLIKAEKADEEYRRLILAADAFFRMEQYTEARGNYVGALEIKPEEAYPARQIERIDEILRQLAEARRVAESQAEEPAADNVRRTEPPVDDANTGIMAEIMDMYNGFIGQADQAFGEEEYNIARFYYYKAIDVRPEEPYPQKRIKEIREIINARMSDRREREYQNNIDKADEALAEGELAVARGYYNLALSAKPLAKYPKMQIGLIREKLKEILGQKNSSEYRSFISQGDKAFETQNYSVARYYYLRAQEINPSEDYPKQQILKIGEELNQ